MALFSIFRRGGRRAAVMAAYHRIVEQARAPALFEGWGVPDTLDGRFEMLSLHAFLVLDRLKAEHAATADFAQDLFDTMFADLDRGMREMGASDIGVGRHVKAMATGFYGRAAAYERGLADDAALADALRRNLFGTAPAAEARVEAAARYVRAQAAALAGVPAAAIMAGEIPFVAAAA